MDTLHPENDRLPSPPLISDRVLINGVITPLTLTADGELQWTESGLRKSTTEKEILSFAVEGNKVKLKTLVERRGSICCGGSGGDYARKDFVFEPLYDESRKLWCDKLRQRLDSLVGRPKRLLVFVNPFGGKKTARKIFLEEVKPLFDDAHVQLDVQETKYQLHAKEMVRSIDLSKYDGIVCVSGDGVLVEVVNGLLERADWRTALKLPIGMVPAGSGNGMIKSLLDPVGLSCSAASATVSIIRGHRRSLDVATISQGTTKFFSVLMLAWGLVADIDIESEKFRWMGSARFDVYGLQRIICLRQYNGRILFVPAPGFESNGKPASYNVDKESSVSDKTVLGYQGPDTNLEDLEWREMKGPFVSVWLHNVPWGAENTLAAPNAKFSDGFLDLIVMKDCPKLALLSLMTKLSDGTHVQSPYVSYLKVKAFVLEPGSRIDEEDKEGIIDSDGEVLARGRRSYKCDEKALMSYGKLQITVDQGLATLFSPE
ncbi:sphingosine kinase 1-like isoform X1 [Raphanus sativus]|uniref:sphingosine kinase n=2 Tax=Raphanus sativus TaxID=3726 RepID=A0A6J0NDI2_RAPSA|nr:sphingosine kinase 1-like isoform X1 [Raphanus sativus]XP_056857604.1 sphingosine kinase 1-like isoform X1 [Raphanus sativus]XP_056857605.1 sphingosine kinase 1-like isoform X1 [Raphanus sativus]